MVLVDYIGMCFTFPNTFGHTVPLAIYVGFYVFQEV
jgi:hypothetical protein